MAGVSLVDVTKEFDGGVVAVDRLSVAAQEGEFLILVGPSGCGKTTALRLIAGLEKPTSGTISIGDRVINELSPRDRDIAMVFQNYALYPHMSVRRNLAFALKERRVSKDRIAGKIEEVSKMLGLEEFLERKPAQLSGGQRQRVAMGRALVRDPKAFLLDEPLSNLDAKLRVQVRGDLKRLHQQVGITTIYVTHDQVEAMTLGDRIAVMSAGRIEQVSTPQDVYDNPATLFVAGFIGSPAMNLLRGVVRNGTVTAGDLTLGMPKLPDGDVVVGLRPKLLRPGPDREGSLRFRVDVVEPLGDGVLVHGTIKGQLAQIIQEEELLPSLLGSEATVTALLEPREAPQPGEQLSLSINPHEVHFFDARTGLAIPVGVSATAIRGRS
jgi:sn-glycerol 3-phosphate transport system ATP-binding protein